MVRFLIAVSVGLASCAPAPPRQETNARASASTPADAIAITNVTVLNVTSGSRETAVTVLTNASQITGVGRGISIPAGAVRVDGTGKFLIPGLWDMHSHHQATGTGSLELYLANGVVGTRDMGSDLEFILPLRDRINRDEVRGPEIIAAGPILDDRPPDWPFRRRVTNAVDGRQAVRDLKTRGVDFIKVHDGTPREAFFAIADEASKAGLPLAGHVPNEVTIEEAVDAGLRSIEHLANFRVYRDCSGNGPYSAARCRSRFAALSAKGVWQTPTMAFFHALPDVFSGKPLAHAEYASDSLLELSRKNAEASKIDERGLSALRSMSQTSLAAVRDLASSGSLLLAGCDGLVPGFCLHDELERMTTAGLSPLQAIQAATVNAAKYFGRAHTQGAIDVGQRADLLLLDADPLIDIRHTRQIAAVVVRGRLIQRPDIDKIMAARRRQ